MKYFLVFLINIIFIKFAFAEKVTLDDDWLGFYLGSYKSEDKLKANGISNTSPDDPYDVSTDNNIYNSGIFFGYNHLFKDIVIGIETSFQDDVGEDEVIPDLNGWVLYDDLFEYKLRIGYSFGKYLAYSFFGSGDLNVYWSDYANEDTTTHDYLTKGIGLTRKITDNIFIGLSISETNFDLSYPDTDYLEAVELDSFRFRLGYLF